MPDAALVGFGDRRAGPWRLECNDLARNVRLPSVRAAGAADHVVVADDEPAPARGGHGHGPLALGADGNAGGSDARPGGPAGTMHRWKGRETKRHRPSFF